jgi:hypothetical protein
MLIGDATAANHPLMDAQAFGQLVQLSPSSMNDDKSDAYLMTEGNFFGKRLKDASLLGDFPAQLDDENLPLKALDVRQGFPQQLQSFVVCTIHRLLIGQMRRTMQMISFVVSLVGDVVHSECEQKISSASGHAPVHR